MKIFTIFVQTSGVSSGKMCCFFLSYCGILILSHLVTCVYRLVEFTRSDGTVGRRVRPYIIDLASGNGTYLNNQRIEPQRYYELKEKDVIKFGFSSREYVLLHEFSDTTEVDAKREEGEDEEDEGVDE